MKKMLFTVGLLAQLNHSLTLFVIWLLSLPLLLDRGQRGQKGDCNSTELYLGKIQWGGEIIEPSHFHYEHIV